MKSTPRNSGSSLRAAGTTLLMLCVISMNLVCSAVNVSAVPMPPANGFFTDFDGNSGGMPAGWTDSVISDASPESTVIESGTIVAVSDHQTMAGGGGPQIIQSNFTFDAASEPDATVTLTAEITSMTSDTGTTDAIVGIGSVTTNSIAAIFRSATKEFQLLIVQGGVFVGAFPLPAGPHLPAYAGGALEVTIALDADSARLTSGTFDSGDMAYSSAGAAGFDSLDDLGTGVGVALGSSAGGSGVVTSTVNFDSALLDIGGEEETPQQQIGSLKGDVQALVTSGAINSGNANALTSKLDGVLSKLEKGQTGAACNQMNAFTNQVNAFVNSGKLTPAQGQSLINAANAIRAAIGC